MPNQHNYFLHSIPSGVAGISATLDIMRRLVMVYKSAPAIRKLGLSIVRNLPPKKKFKEARAVQVWVQNNIRYCHDINGVETVQTPIETLKQGQGDCDDQAVLSASLLETIGLPTRLVAVAKSPRQFSHVLTEVRIGDKWYPLETTNPWPFGKFPPNVVQKMVRHNK